MHTMISDVIFNELVANTAALMYSFTFPMTAPSFVPSSTCTRFVKNQVPTFLLQLQNIFQLFASARICSAHFAHPKFVSSYGRSELSASTFRSCPNPLLQLQIFSAHFAPSKFAPSCVHSVVSVSTICSCTNPLLMLQICSAHFVLF